MALDCAHVLTALWRLARRRPRLLCCAVLIGAACSSGPQLTDDEAPGPDGVSPGGEASTGAAAGSSGTTAGGGAGGSAEAGVGGISGSQAGFSGATVAGAGTGEAGARTSGGAAGAPSTSGGAGGTASQSAGAGGEAAVCEPPPVLEAGTSPSTRFAVIGDYGLAGAGEQAVADLVQSSDVDFVVTLGDNNYEEGEQATIDENIGQYFHEFICPYRGDYGAGAGVNRFFPALGNHDWRTPDLAPYLSYFALPGNERYYDVVWNDVHLFSIDSDPHEPDGNTADSVQAAWLKERLAESSARFKIVYMHHPPYSSGRHGSSVELRWPYAEWGVDLVLSGHDHIYERLQVGDLVYVVNGLGGKTMYDVTEPLEESVVSYTEAFGALFITVEQDELVGSFVNVEHEVIDEFALPAN